jgi:hypothetical protein
LNGESCDGRGRKGGEGRKRGLENARQTKAKKRTDEKGVITDSKTQREIKKKKVLIIIIIIITPTYIYILAGK